MARLQRSLLVPSTKGGSMVWRLWVLFAAVLLLNGSVVWARVSYYDILGVSKTASSKEIQRAYRKLALQHHPDKGGDEEKFKELGKAYECLSDPGKRQVYDCYGEAGLDANPNGGGDGGFAGFPFGSAAGDGGGGTPFTFFSSSGNGGSFPGSEFFSFGGGGDGNNRNGNVDLSELLKEMFMGGGVSNGDASSSFFSPGAFASRRGPFAQGQQSSHRHSSNQQNSSRSSQTKRKTLPTFTRPVYCTLEDLALGRTKKMKVAYQGHEKVFEIVLKPGWKQGTRITFAPSNNNNKKKKTTKSKENGTHDPQADESWFPATMIFEIQESPHPYLRRDNNDLHYTCWITESQTKGGIRVSIPLPTGDVWTHHVPKSAKKTYTKDNKAEEEDDADKVVVVPNGKKMVIPSMGMPIKGGPERGDLIVHFRVRKSSSPSSSAAA